MGGLRQLDLDFGSRRARGSRAGLLLLAIAIVFVADLGVSYRELRGTVAQKEERIATLERPRAVTGRPPAAGGRAPAAAGRSRGAAANGTPEEIAFARETIARLSTPWDSLFRALEASATDRVSLLAIEPDPKSGTVLISADGADYLAALSYVADLRRSSALANVHLVKHEQRAGNAPQRALSFSVSAAWTSARPDSTGTPNPASPNATANAPAPQAPAPSDPPQAAAAPPAPPPAPEKAPS
jgi:hypothetical protein